MGRGDLLKKRFRFFFIVTRRHFSQFSLESKRPKLVTLLVTDHLNAIAIHIQTQNIFYTHIDE